MERKQPGNFSKEFKREVVELILRGEKTIPEIGRDLGINPRNLYRWRKAIEEDPQEAFPGKGYQKSADEELRQLKKALSDALEERDILKKAISIFSKTK